MSNLLGNLLSKVKETSESVSEAPPSKRARFEQACDMDPLKAIENFCEQVQQKLSEYPPEQKDKIEVEARLGLIINDGMRATPRILQKGTTVLYGEMMRTANYRFVSGVDPSTFYKMVPKISKSFRLKGQPANLQETVFNMSNGIRVKWDSRHKRGLSEQKTRIAECNFLLPSCPFDFRIAVSMEQPGEMVASPPSDWQQKRIKNRTSLSLEGNPWRVDITDVEAEDMMALGRGKVAVHEVEFEVQHAALVRWLAPAAAAPAAAAAAPAAASPPALGAALWELLRRVNPAGVEEGLTGLARCPDGAGPGGCEGGAARARLAGLRLAQTGRRGPEGREFPGAMPVNLCRRHVPRVQKADYYVTEKTDGVRYLLVVVAADPPAEGEGEGKGEGEGPRRRAVLVDRKMGCFVLPGGDKIGEALEEGTVLDGELTYNLTLKRQVFICFDLLCWGKDSYMNNTFADRLDVLARVAFERYNDAVKGGRINLEETTPMVKKEFYPRREIGRLMKRFREEDGGRVFHDAAAAARRHHRSDGVILQPNAAYEVGTHTELFKWKWADAVTVDLEVTLRGDSDRLQLACGGPQGRAVDVTALVCLGEADQLRLAADARDHAHAPPPPGGGGGDGANGGGGPGPVIAEIAFDTDTGMWTYKMLRPDKNQPNYVTTVMSTMIELAEGICGEELQYRMSASHPSRDDWGTQLKKMQGKAVLFRMQNPV